MVTHRFVSAFPVKKLRPNPRNARTHPRKQIRQLKKSILKFGCIVAIVVDENNTIILGHGRYQACIELGIRDVPILVVTGLSDVEKRVLAVADNKIAANGGYNRKLLAEELGDFVKLLPEIGLDLDITGFEPAEVDSLLGDLVDPESDPADELPALQVEVVSKVGDLWKLGLHGLLCGNALSSSAYRVLMGDELAAMVFADPPYNVPTNSIQGRGRIKHRNFVQGSGEMSPAEFTRFLSRSLGNAAKYSADGAIHFAFIDWRHIRELLAAGATVYSELKNIAIWVKTNAGQGSFYRSQHELICVFKSGEGAHLNNIELGRHGRNRSNVWTYAGVNSFRAGRMEDLSAHPTVKPVALVADAMRDCSRRGDIILDPFMGSGTTILAAERIGRRGYGIELDPLYVDTAIRRWQAFTKCDAILAETGQTFEEVAAIRRKVGGRS